MPLSTAFERTVGIVVTAALGGLLFIGVSEAIRFFSRKPVSKSRVLYAFAFGCFVAGVCEFAMTRH